MIVRTNMYAVPSSASSWQQCGFLSGIILFGWLAAPNYALTNHPSVLNWGSTADISALNQWMDDIAAWSKSHHLPIYYGEFACNHAQNVTTGRDKWYSEHRKAIDSHGFAASVWDDDGGFKLYDRQADTWDEGVLKALGKSDS